MSRAIHCLPPSAKQIGAVGSSNAIAPHAVSDKAPLSHRTPNPISQQTKGFLCALWRTINGIPQGVCPRHPPGLERDVAVEHPAVLELHGLGGGGQVVGRRSGRVDLVPAIGERVPVEGVGRGVMMGQGMVVRRRERWPQR